MLKDNGANKPLQHIHTQLALLLIVGVCLLPFSGRVTFLLQNPLCPLRPSRLEVEKKKAQIDCLPFAPPLPQILDVRNVMVVVSRWYGGIQLGPDRFKHINNCARNILVEEGYAASTVRLSPGLLWISLSSSTDTSSVKLGRAVSSPVAGKHLLYCLVCD